MQRSLAAVLERYLYWQVLSIRGMREKEKIRPVTVKLFICNESVVGTLALGLLAVQSRGNVHGFESHLRQLIFSRKSDCLGCAVLLCLVCLFDLACFFLLPSHLSFKNMYIGGVTNRV